MVTTGLVKRIQETYLARRLQALCHRLTYHRRSEVMAKAWERFKRSETKKPVRQQRREVRLCRRFWRCYPLHYYRYNLYEEQCQVSEQELLDYIPEFFFYRLFLPHYHSRSYRVLVEDKIVAEQYFRSVGIAQPRTVCKVIKGSLYAADLTDRSFGSIRRDVDESGYQKLFVKPAIGLGGYGIYVFERKENGDYVTEGNDTFDEPFLRRISASNDYIVQAGLEQHAELQSIYPRSVNTFRLATENLDGTVRVLCATLRMGRDGKQVDNRSQGGMLVPVDVEAGRLGDYAAMEPGDRIERHPDTGFVFSGYRLTQWDDVRDFAILSAKKMPHFGYLGWDIALSTGGPVAIEANLAFGVDYYQILLGGLRQLFRIADPMSYWRKPVHQTQL